MISTIVSGVVVCWRSSLRVAREPATAQMQARARKPARKNRTYQIAAVATPPSISLNGVKLIPTSPTAR